MTRGRQLVEAGRGEEGLARFHAVIAANPDDFEALEALGYAFIGLDEFDKAESFLVRAASSAPSPEARAGAQFAAAWCNLRMRRASRALKFYIAAGRLPPKAAEILHAPEKFSDDDIRVLSNDQAGHLMEVSYCAQSYDVALRTANILKDRGDNLKTHTVLALVWPSILRELGRHEEAGAAYVAIQRAGGYAADYRPKWPRHHLARVSPETALKLHSGERARFTERLGARPAPDSHPAARTLGAGPIGLEGAFLCGDVASAEAGTKYYFQYGPAPDRLTLSTPPRYLPPPRSAVVRQRAQRHFEWNPQATMMSWEGRHVPGVEGQMQSCVLRLSGPFATDRNQLNGMGPHEMMLGMRWAWDPEAIGGHDSLAATGGIMDLRDGEFTIVARGDGLKLNGTSLTFWAARTTPITEVT